MSTKNFFEYLRKRLILENKYHMEGIQGFSYNILSDCGYYVRLGMNYDKALECVYESYLNRVHNLSCQEQTKSTVWRIHLFTIFVTSYEKYFKK